MGERVTMQAVAKAAGVHQTTVSLALRRDPRLSTETGQRVREIARQLGYAPNPLVSALIASRHRRSETRQACLGYVSFDEPDHGGAEAIRGYADFHTGARERAAELGYGLDHFWLGDPKMTKGRFNQITATRGIRGLILAPMARSRDTFNLDWARFSTVAYGYAIASPRLHRVNPDFYHGMVEALRRCREAGHQRAGLILEENVDRKVDHFWLSAYLAEQQINPRATPVPPLRAPVIDVPAVERWFDQHRPTVIVALGRVIELVEPWLSARGVHIGRDVSLVSLNVDVNEPHAHWSGVFIDRRRVGSICIDFLVAMLHRNETGVPAGAQNLLVETGWRDGTTLAPAV